MYSLGLTNNIIWVTRERERASERYLHLLCTSSIHTPARTQPQPIQYVADDTFRCSIFLVVFIPSTFFNRFYDIIFILRIAKRLFFPSRVRVIINKPRPKKRRHNFLWNSHHHLRRAASKKLKFFSKFMFSTRIYVFAPGYILFSLAIFTCVCCVHKKTFSSSLRLQEDNCSAALWTKKFSLERRLDDDER